LTLLDIVGLVGAVVILGAYAAVQMERLDARSWTALALNFAGASFILLSMIKAFNLSAAVVEGCWALVALYGMVRKLKR
jgi:hypothetical protein